jgi:hypothetical protein
MLYGGLATLPDVETPVVVKTVPSETEAEIACALLRSVGIKCGYRVPDIAQQGFWGMEGDPRRGGRPCSGSGLAGRHAVG